MERAARIDELLDELDDCRTEWDGTVGLIDSFSLGERRERIAEFYHHWKPGGAHNGYLDTYLDLGLIGLSPNNIILGCFFLWHFLLALRSRRRRDESDLWRGT